MRPPYAFGAALVLVVACALIAPCADAEAFPAPVHDRVWAVSQPWIRLDAGSAATAQVHITGATTYCDDPIPARGEALCAAAAPPDLVVHLLASGSGELGSGQTCAGSECTLSWQLPPGAGPFAVMIHGGTTQRGRASGTVELLADGALVSSQLLALSDNVLLDLEGAPTAGFDVETVLMPDGPTVASGVGNALNDFLGADATELWLLDGTRKLVAADVAQSGVGPAGRLTAAVIQASGARYVLARPWTPPPSAFVVALAGAELTFASGPTHVGAGRMRVVVNDWQAADTDTDGLSNLLELAPQVRTCNGLTFRMDGRACVTAALFQSAPQRAFMDPRDTDGDGISDAAEVLGSDIAMGTTALGGACSAIAAPSTVLNANQTLPLWGFNPRHKDALVEIDLEGQTTTGLCPTPFSGCSAGYNQALPPAGTSLATYLGSLRTWHDRYATLPALRVNNPDGRNGIEVHFNVSTEPVPSNAHGTRSQFVLTDSSGVERPGLIVYHPAGTPSGSSCSCNNQLNCADHRHGGFGRHATVTWRPGGGAAPCGGRIGCGLGSGQTCAHEMGHHLGLQHGGPDHACNNNPFGYTTLTAWDLLNETKHVHYSTMNYSYGSAPFSVGRYLPTPLPRAAPNYLLDIAGNYVDHGNLFGYPEVHTFTPETTAPLRLYSTALLRPTPGPTGCTDLCDHADFNRDGAFEGVMRGAAEMGGYERGRFAWLEQGGYYCAGEQAPAVRGVCCPAGPRDALGRCPAMMGTTASLPWLPATSRTMLFSGQPAAVVANDRFYGVFLDDVTPDPTTAASASVPERRAVCTTVGPGAPTSCPPRNTAKLRWSAFDSFSVPLARQGRPNACTGEGVDCVARTENMIGDLTVQAQPVFSGSTQLAAASFVPSGILLPETVLLAWATRTNAMTGNGLQCTAGTAPRCINDWQPMGVRLADAPQMTATGAGNGFTIRGADGTTLFNDLRATQPLRGDHISGVAAAAWDPYNDGAPTRTFLVAREAGLSDASEQGGQLFWTLCTTTGCGQMQPLTGVDAAGNPITGTLFSDTSIALAVEHPTTPGTPPSLVLVMGLPHPTSPNQAGLYAVRMSPRPPGASDFVRRQVPIQQGPTGDIWVANYESSVSVAFTPASEGNRMVFTNEWAPVRPLVRFVSATKEFDEADGMYIAAQHYFNQWDISRAWIGVTTNPAGAPMLQFADGPGFVPALAHDPRSAATLQTDTDTSVFENTVRAVRAAMHQGGPVLQLNPMVDPRPLAEMYNYDDVNTIAYELCPTLTNGGRSLLGPDLRYRGSALGELRCPSAADWGRNSGIVPNNLPVMRWCCDGPGCSFGDTTDCWITYVVDVVTEPYMYKGPIPMPPDEGLVPPTPVGVPDACWANRETLLPSASGSVQ